MNDCACAATTKNGTPCLRNATVRQMCWQHWNAYVQASLDRDLKDPQFVADIQESRRQMFEMMRNDPTLGVSGPAKTENTQFGEAEDQ